MTQHPTKEQVESAKAFVAGEATNEQWTLLVELHGTNDLLVVYSAAGNILAAALAGAERDAEIGRLAIALELAWAEAVKLQAPYTWRKWNRACAALKHAIDVAMAAQRKEGE